MEIKNIKIGNKTLGLGKDVFISAEVGTTCNGDVETAKKLIDAAKDAGMDAVKFQILNPDDKFSDKTIEYTYTRHGGEVVSENIYEMLKQYVLSFDEWKKIKEYADKKEMIMFATPDYLEGVDIMEKLGMPAYKIATWDTNFYPFIAKIAALGKPVVVDLGASTEEEVARILDIFKEKGSSQVILLHCYHTKNYAEMNLRTIEYLRENFGCLSGFSAPDANNDIDYLSLAFRPVYIEKRLTLNRKDPRHHHSQALEPEEMKAYVKRIRELSQAVGEYKLEPTQGDLEMKKKHFRCLVAKKEIKQGEKLTEENVACRQPYFAGIAPENLEKVLGQKAKIDIAENEAITWKKIQ